MLNQTRDCSSAQYFRQGYGGKKYPKAANYGRAHELPRANEWIVTRAVSKSLIPSVCSHERQDSSTEGKEKC